MPGVDRECTTHHYACDCREAKFAALEAENERLARTIADLRVLITEMVEGKEA